MLFLFRTPFHAHPQSVINHILKGKIHCVFSADKIKVFSEGNGFAKTFFNMLHLCERTGNEPVDCFFAPQ